MLASGKGWRAPPRNVGASGKRLRQLGRFNYTSVERTERVESDAPPEGLAKYRVCAPFAVASDFTAGHQCAVPFGDKP